MYLSALYVKKRVLIQHACLMYFNNLENSTFQLKQFRTTALKQLTTIRRTDCEIFLMNILDFGQYLEVFGPESILRKQAVNITYTCE